MPAQRARSSACAVPGGIRRSRRASPAPRAGSGSSGVMSPEAIRSARARPSSQRTAGSETRPASCSASAAHTSPLAGREPAVRAGRAAHRARGEARVKAGERQQLEEVALGDGGGVEGPSSRARRPESKSRNSRTLRSCSSATLSARLHHGLGGRDQLEVHSDASERADDLRLRDGVQVPALVQQQGDVGEGLQSRAELAVRPADALRDGADLARALGQDRNDLVGLAQLDRPQDDALFLVEGHGC